MLNGNPSLNGEVLPPEQRPLEVQTAKAVVDMLHAKLEGPQQGEFLGKVTSMLRLLYEKDRR
jgi:hypothetical protein